MDFGDCGSHVCEQVLSARGKSPFYAFLHLDIKPHGVHDWKPPVEKTIKNNTLKQHKNNNKNIRLLFNLQMVETASQCCSFHVYLTRGLHYCSGLKLREDLRCMCLSLCVDLGLAVLICLLTSLVWIDMGSSFQALRACFQKLLQSPQLGSTCLQLTFFAAGKCQTLRHICQLIQNHGRTHLAILFSLLEAGLTKRRSLRLLCRIVFLDGLQHKVETRHSLVLCLMMCPVGLISHFVTKVHPLNPELHSFARLIDRNQ